MVNKHEVFDKVFMNEEEYYDHLLQEAKKRHIERKKLGKRIAHALGIHFYETVKDDEEHKVGKCKLCTKCATFGSDEFGLMIACTMIGLCLLIFGPIVLGISLISFVGTISEIIAAISGFLMTWAGIRCVKRVIMEAVWD